MTTNTADFRQAADLWTARLAEVKDDAPALAQWRRDSLATWIAATQSTPTAQGLGRIHAALADVGVRDAAALLPIFPDLATVFDGDEDAAKGRLAKGFDQVFKDASLTPDDVEVNKALAVLVKVAEHSPSAPVHATLALLAWWADDKEQATTWVHQALDADDKHTLAVLVAMTLAAGIRPAWAKFSRAA